MFLICSYYALTFCLICSYYAVLILNFLHFFHFRPPTAQFDLRAQLEEHMSFSLPEPHPCASDPFMHPVNLVFIALNELNMGFQPVTSLSAEKNVQAFYSAHLMTFVYYVLAEYFAKDGCSDIVGAASMRQICSNPVTNMRYKILKNVVNAEYTKYFRGDHWKKYNSMLISYLKLTPLMPADMIAGTMAATIDEDLAEEDEEENFIPGIEPVGNKLFLLLYFFPLTNYINNNTVMVEFDDPPLSTTRQTPQSANRMPIISLAGEADSTVEGHEETGDNAEETEDEDKLGAYQKALSAKNTKKPITKTTKRTRSAPASTSPVQEAGSSKDHAAAAAAKRPRRL